MIPNACVVHQIRDRVRLRVDAKRKDGFWFKQARLRIAEIPGIDEVRVNSITGSVLVLHPALPYPMLEQQLQELGLFDIGTGNVVEGCVEQPPYQPLVAGVSKVNKGLAAASYGAVDLQGLLFLAVMFLASRKYPRASLILPLLPVLWDAWVFASNHIRAQKEKAEPEQAESTIVVAEEARA